MGKGHEAAGPIVCLARKQRTWNAAAQLILPIYVIPAHEMRTPTFRVDSFASINQI